MLIENITSKIQIPSGLRRAIAANCLEYCLSRNPRVYVDLVLDRMKMSRRLF